MPLHIFIADDDSDDLEVLEEAILEVEPDSVVTKAASGKLAMEYFKDCSGAMPHLIILDYNMPETTGADILDYLATHAQCKDIVKVIMSTSNAPRHIAECMSKGAADYFVKPTTKQELDNTIRKLLSLASA